MANPNTACPFACLRGPKDSFEYDATVEQSVATLGEPMVVRSTYENRGNGEETEESTMPRSPSVFSRDSGATGDAPDIALMDPDTGYDQRYPGCWTPDVDSISVILGQFDISDLPPGTTVHIDHAVWQNPRALDDQEQCLQPGTYEVPLRFGLGVELEVAVEAPSLGRPPSELATRVRRRRARSRRPSPTPR